MFSIREIIFIAFLHKVQNNFNFEFCEIQENFAIREFNNFAKTRKFSQPPCLLYSILMTRGGHRCT